MWLQAHLNVRTFHHTPLSYTLNYDFKHNPEPLRVPRIAQLGLGGIRLASDAVGVEGASIFFIDLKDQAPHVLLASLAGACYILWHSRRKGWERRRYGVIVTRFLVPRDKAGGASSDLTNGRFWVE